MHPPDDVTSAKAQPSEHGSAQLPQIPVVDTGPSFAIETLIAEEARAHDLLDNATRRIPPFALRAVDRPSRRWLKRWKNSHLDEIDAVAHRLSRPGVYFFSINYEWGCTCRVAPSPEKRSARLVRVLDWITPGLGRNVIAARVSSQMGPFVTLTWPGYTGILTAMAPGRFSAALNQAPMQQTAGLFVLDWIINRRRVWTMPYQTPAHLLRSVFEQAATFEEARDRLINEPVSTPTIFSLAGTKSSETVVIERKEREARVHDGDNAAANHWQAPGWHGYPRGEKSAERAWLMHTVVPEFECDFPWLERPILNRMTRLAVVADAAQGRIIARGYEAMEPATACLDLTVT